jgi:hypothetical protein
MKNFLLSIQIIGCCLLALWLGYQTRRAINAIDKIYIIEKQVNDIKQSQQYMLNCIISLENTNK